MEHKIKDDIVSLNVT